MKQDLELRVISLLTMATRRHAIQWEPLIGDCYRSAAGLRFYHLRWLYWYDVSGITLGRQGMVISFQDRDMVFLWGTDGMEAAKNLLNVIDDKWESYHRGISMGCTSMLPSGYTASQPSPIHQSCLLTLAWMLDATKSGAMTWSRDERHPTVFTSFVADHEVEIRFFSPIDTEDKPLGQLVAQLSLPAANVTFCCGTEGFFIIEEILSASMPEFRTRLDACEEALRVEIDHLAHLIDSQD